MSVETTQTSSRPRVVIVGGGFAGLNAAKGLARLPVEVVLLDRTNHHVFQPLLYQVAAAALSPRDIARPLRDVLRRQGNASVLMAEVTGFDRDRRAVLLGDGSELRYDYLLIAIGARHSYFGHPEWEAEAPGLKTLNDALELRRRILLEFERAERRALRARARGQEEPDDELTFVVVGAGPTGVEMAGAIAEIAHRTLRRNFRLIDPKRTRTLLVEAAERVLPPFPAGLGAKAKSQLETLGVEVFVDTRVTALGDGSVTLESDGVPPRTIDSNCVVWAAGNEVSDVLASLGADRDRSGRVMVEPDLSIVDDANVFVLGDAAHCLNAEGQPLPGLAPVAMQQGKAVARNIRRDLRGGSRKPFAYWDRGTMATIGKARAVAWIGRLRFGGLAAWLAWSLVHILFLIGFRTKLVVMLEWIVLYLFNRRDARLLHGFEAPLDFSRRASGEEPKIRVDDDQG